MMFRAEALPTPLQEAGAGRQSPRPALRVPPHQRGDDYDLDHGKFELRDKRKSVGGVMASAVGRCDHIRQPR